MAIIIATIGLIISASGAFKLGDEDKTPAIKLVALGNFLMMISMCFRGV